MMSPGNLCEDIDCDLFSKRWTNKVDEVLKLLLFMLSALGSDQVCSDKLLRLFWQVHIFHRRICNIDLILEIGSLFSDL